MHTEIENLINMALADGEVTEKERAIILRKAESLGIDKDEVEMILDGRIALIHKAPPHRKFSILKAIKQAIRKNAPLVALLCSHFLRNVPIVVMNLII